MRPAFFGATGPDCAVPGGPGSRYLRPDPSSVRPNLARYCWRLPCEPLFFFRLSSWTSCGPLIEQGRRQCTSPERELLGQSRSDSAFVACLVARPEVSLGRIGCTFSSLSLPGLRDMDRGAALRAPPPPKRTRRQSWAAMHSKVCSAFGASDGDTHSRPHLISRRAARGGRRPPLRLLPERSRAGGHGARRSDERALSMVTARGA